MRELQSLTLSPAAISELETDGSLQACVDASTKEATQLYETRKFVITPPVCAAHVRCPADLGATFEREVGQPAVVLRFDARHTTPEELDSLTSAQTACIEVKKTSLTACVSYFTLQAAAENSAGHKVSVALETLSMLSVVLHALHVGHSHLAFVFVWGDAVSTAKFALLKIDSSLVEMLQASVATAQSYVPPTGALALKAAKDKASKYGEEPALFMPYEMRPRPGLKLELRLARLRSMYNSKRRAA